jgi:hypothetical protein
MGLVVVAAGPASAQRDPFDPVTGPQNDSSQEDESTQGGVFEEPEGDSQGTVEEPTEPEVNPNQNQDNGSDALANTGADISGWLVLAYGLIVAGAGSILVGRMWRPQTSPR